MKIAEEKIEEIRLAADIVDVISKQIQLRPAGKNFKGLCPFHQEKTPSFVVSRDKQIYHCFGCHAGGNVFKFLMEFNKISFVEAVEELASEYGIQIDYNDAQFSQEQSETELLYDITVEAAKHYSDNLLNNPKGEIARKYFLNRHLTLRTLRTFGLGYGLPSWNGLVHHFNNKGVSEEKAIQLGLLGKSEKGNVYDRYTDRLIFPIFSTNGRVVAIAGRILKKDKKDAPKYVNSPESQIYHKSKILYGLSHAKDEIRRNDFAVIVEGYMDLISLYQEGIKNVVAVSGTALTDEQVNLLSRFTKNVFLIFDADTAGIHASMRSIEILLKQNMNVRIVTLPKGEDPDSFIHEKGKSAFMEQIEEAMNFLEFQTSVFQREGKFETPESTAEAIRDLVNPLVFIDDELKRVTLIKSLAEKFSLREKLLEKELDSAIERYERSRQRSIQREQSSQQEPIEEKIVQSESTLSSMRKNEQALLRLMLEGNQQALEIIFHNVEPEEFSSPRDIKFATMIFNEWNKGKSVSAGSIMDIIESEEERKFIGELAFEKHSLSDKALATMDVSNDKMRVLGETIDTVKKFRILRIEQEIRKFDTKIQKNPPEDEVLELLQEKKFFDDEKKKIEEEFEHLKKDMLS